MYFDYASVLIYIAVAVVFVIGSLTAGWLLRKNHPYDQKTATYECGEDTIGSAFVQFNVRFYIIALIFLIFDVEVAILYPWATVYKEGGITAFIEMFVFMGILLVGLAYVWVKKDLEWIKSMVIEVKTKDEVTGGQAAGQLK